MPVIEIVVPACLKLGKTRKAKNYYLNMNNFRNWHHSICHNTKLKFNELILGEFLRIPKMKYINQLQYTLIVTTKTKRDRMNVYSIVDKYFCDALQTYKKIEDDSDDFIGDFIFKQSEYIKGPAEEIRVHIKLTYNE